MERMFNKFTQTVKIDVEKDVEVTASDDAIIEAAKEVFEDGDAPLIDIAATHYLRNKNSFLMKVLAVADAKENGLSASVDELDSDLVVMD